MPSSRLVSIARQGALRGALCGVLCGVFCSPLLPLNAGAVALGESTVRSPLGQSLEAEIAIVSLAAREADTLVVRNATAAMYSEAGIDYTPLLRSLRVSVEKRGEQQVIRVRSDLPVNDPFVRLMVELNGNGSRMVREYALLIDPPLLDAPAGSAVATDVAPTPKQTRERSDGPEPQPDVRAGATDTTSTATSLPDVAVQARESAVQARESAVPMLAATHRVQRGETLRAIGASIQPEGVRIEQVLFALQQANPGAFVGRNINRLRQGSVLKLPGADAMREVDPAKAQRSLRRQAAEFVRSQRPATPAAAGKADSSSSTGNRRSSGQVGTSSAAPPTPAQSNDRLTLSPPGTGEHSSTKPAANDALDKIAGDKALADASARIAALEKNVGQLQQMLEVHNGQMAAAQQRATGSATLPTPTAPARPAPAEPAAEPAAMPPATATAPVNPDTAPQPSASEQKPEQEAEQKAEPPPERKQLPSPPRHATPVAEPEPTLWSTLTEPLSLLAGAALLLLSVAWLGLRRYRRSQVANAQTQEPTLASQTVIADAGGRHVDTRHSEFHSNFVPSVSQIDANEVDPLAEADVYIAYGRDEQAEEILRDALRMHPQRDALRVKLLEIYAGRKDRQQFSVLAAELRVRTHGAGSDWERAAQLGRQLDPGNRLFDGSVGAVPIETFASSQQVTAESTPIDDFGLRLDELLNERRGAEPPAAPLADSVQDVKASASNSLDFSLAGIDLGSSSSGAGPSAGALTTKLELAQACLEIGDRDGARELLNEVIASGDPELAPRAQSLLRQLA